MKAIGRITPLWKMIIASATVILLTVVFVHIRPAKHRIIVFYDLPVLESEQNQMSFEKELTDQFKKRGTVRFIPIKRAQLKPVAEMDQMMSDSIEADVKRDATPDLIVVSGEYCTRAAAETENLRLKLMPIIYINVLAPEQIPSLKHRRNMTGRWIEPDIRKNVDLVRKLFGNRWIMTQIDDYESDRRMLEKIKSQLTDTVLYRVDDDFTNPGRYTSKFVKEPEKTYFIPLSLHNPSANYRKDDPAKGYDYMELMNCRQDSTTYILTTRSSYIYLSFRGAIWQYLTLLPEGFNIKERNIHNTCLGGYMTPYSVMAEEAALIADTLLAGTDPERLESRPHKADYWLDWREMQDGSNTVADFPKEYHFINVPWYEKNRLFKWLYTSGARDTIITILLLCAFMLFISDLGKRYERHHLMKHAKRAKESNDQMLTALSLSHSYLWYLDGNDVILSNHAMEKLGMKRKRFPLMMLLKIIREKEIRTLLASEFANTSNMDDLKEPKVTIKIGKTVHTLELNIYHTAFNKKRVVMGTFFIIDEQLVHEKKMRESLMADEESQMREAFIASLGHEIRTPINAISGFSDLLVEMHGQLDAEERQSYYQMIESNQEQLLTLLDNVINNASQTEDFEKTMITIPVRDIVVELYKTHSVIVPQHLQFKLKEGPDDAKIHVSRTSLRQIISNFVNNAGKFTKKGYIALGWTADEEEVHIFVEDSGIGMSEEDTVNVFKQFFKKDFTSEGAGLGLPLCQKLAIAMHGHLSVTSEEGVGSTFTLNLPRV